MSSDTSTVVTVYVPADPEHTTLLPGSGIVSAAPEAGGRILVDYEGNAYGSHGFEIYANRVDHAASRHLTKYPTVARSNYRVSDLIEVGYYDTVSGDVHLSDPDKVAAWCGISVQELSGQLASTSGHHVRRREVHTALASHDPAVRFAGQQMAKRLRIS